MVLNLNVEGTTQRNVEQTNNQHLCNRSSTLLSGHLC
jgi:hypothetical protein